MAALADISAGALPQDGRCSAGQYLSHLPFRQKQPCAVRAGGCVGEEGGPGEARFEIKRRQLEDERIAEAEGSCHDHNWGDEDKHGICGSGERGTATNCLCEKTKNM